MPPPVRQLHRPLLRALPAGGACRRAAPPPAGSRADDTRGEEPGPKAVGRAPRPSHRLECAPGEAPGLRFGHVATASEFAKKLGEILVVSLFRGPLAWTPVERPRRGVARLKHHVRLQSPFVGKTALGGGRSVRNPSFSLSAAAFRLPSPGMRSVTSLIRVAFSESDIGCAVPPRRSAKSHCAPSTWAGDIVVCLRSAPWSWANSRPAF
jgi:hypothetical protein